MAFVLNVNLVIKLIEQVTACNVEKTAWNASKGNVLLVKSLSKILKLLLALKSVHYVKTN